MPHIQKSSESVNVDILRYVIIDQSPILYDELDVLSLRWRNSQDKNYLKFNEFSLENGCNTLSINDFQGKVHF